MEQKPLPLRDMFPQANPERIKALVNDPNLRARSALIRIVKEVASRIRAGTDVKELDDLVKKAYTPSMVALENQLARDGWTQEEIAAAHMVDQGSMEL